MWSESGWLKLSVKVQSRRFALKVDHRRVLCYANMRTGLDVCEFRYTLKIWKSAWKENQDRVILEKRKKLEESDEQAQASD